MISNLNSFVLSACIFPPDEQLWVVIGSVTGAGDTNDLLVIKRKDGSDTKVVTKSYVKTNNVNN